MKNTLIAILFLIIPLACALYGGETWEYTPEDCDNFTLDILGTETIDDGEYSMNYNCTELQSDYWLCNCTGVIFKITYTSNTINNYTYIFNYNSTEIINDESSDDDSSSSSGSGGGGGGGGGGYVSISGTTLRTILLKPNIYYRFKLGSITHSIKMVDVTTTAAGFQVESEPVEFSLNVGEQKQIDVNSDGTYDVLFILKEIRGRVAVLKLKEISVKATQAVQPTATNTTETPIINATQPGNETEQELITIDLEQDSGIPAGIKFLSVILSMFIIIFIIYMIMKSRGE